MEQLIQDTVDFLEEEKDTTYNLFLTTITTELVIPKTRPAIKEYVLPMYKEIRKANVLLRYLSIPLAKRTNNPLLKDKVEEDFMNYFEQEKECLKKIKVLLNTKSNECPNISFSGILLTAVSKLHLVNQDKLLTIIETGTSLQSGAFTAYIPDNNLIPANQEIINNINTGLDRVLVKEKKLHN